MRILSPIPYRVYQRGYAFPVLLAGTDAESCRITVTAIKTGREIAQTEIGLRAAGQGREGELLLPAGGWYVLRISADGEDEAVYPVGVGEVFVIAGQSHATNSNNRQFRVQDPEGRITVYDPFGDFWRVAHDRQPCYDSSDYNARFGSLWPNTFDHLIRQLDMPIGMVNAAYGASALFQWQPGHECGFYNNLVTCARAAGSFRCIMWQQGESDVMWHTETQAYVDGMVALRDALAKDLGKESDWLIAKSTIHPSAYTDPEHEQKIRDAYEILYTMPHFCPGPDTDTLNGDCRDRGEFSGHMTEKGMLRAGELWCRTLLDYIQSKQ